MHTSTQLPTVFGGEFVQEQHGDDAGRHLPDLSLDEAVHFLSASLFEEILKSLRAALSLR